MSRDANKRLLLRAKARAEIVKELLAVIDESGRLGRSANWVGANFEQAAAEAIADALLAGSIPGCTVAQ